jgi:hyperosmotically inducible protein
MDRKNLFVAGLSASLMLAASAAWANDPNTKSSQPVTDTVITTKVKTELAKDDQTKARHIDVETKDGVVHLSGLVDSDMEKQKAEADAQSIDGVISVKNSLKVKR